MGSVRRYTALRGATVTPRERRALAAGAVLIALAVLARGAPRMVSSVGRLRERAAARHEAVRDARAMLASQQAVADSLRGLLGDLNTLAPKLLAGTAHAEAGASLASYLQLVATRHALRVVRLEALADSTPGSVCAVSARLEVEGDIRGLGGLLATLESELPVLTVRALTISAPEPGAPRRAPERLRATLTVSGWHFATGAS